MASRIAFSGSVVGALLLTNCGTPTALQAVRAQVGSIATTSTFTAAASPQWTVNLVPSSAGKVVSLNVKLGQSVSQGEVIAELDKRALQDAVAQAEADVAAARAKADSVQAGARPEDIAAAQATAGSARATVAQAQAGLASAQQKLDAAQAGGRHESVLQAQAKVDGDQAALAKLLKGATAEQVTLAKLAVEQSKDKLFADQTQNDALVAQGGMTRESRQAALDVDQTAIDQANTQLAQLLAPPRAEDVQQLKATLDADRQALALAEQPNRPQDVAQLQQGVVAAQAQVAQAQSQATAQQALASKATNLYTAQDLAQAQAAVQSAEAVLQTAQTALSSATVVAPADGIISEVDVAVGSLATPTTPIATEVATGLEFEADVAQDQLQLFSQGQAATIVAACDRVPSHVAAIAPVADPKTRTFAIKVQPDSASNSLRAGMSVTVQFETARVDDAIAVPASAVQQRNGQDIVFKAVDGKARVSAVQVGLRNPVLVQVARGLEADDLVLLAPPAQLTDGQSVTASVIEVRTVPEC